MTDSDRMRELGRLSGEARRRKRAPPKPTETDGAVEGIVGALPLDPEKREQLEPLWRRVIGGALSGSAKGARPTPMLLVYVGARGDLGDNHGESQEGIMDLDQLEREMRRAWGQLEVASMLGKSTQKHIKNMERLIEVAHRQEDLHLYIFYRNQIMKYKKT